MARNLSISKTGQYLTEGTGASVGATVPSTDRVFRQVAVAVQVMNGLFRLEPTHGGAVLVGQKTTDMVNCLQHTRDSNFVRC